MESIAAKTHGYQLATGSFKVVIGAAIVTTLMAAITSLLTTIALFGINRFGPPEWRRGRR